MLHLPTSVAGIANLCPFLRVQRRDPCCFLRPPGAVEDFGVAIEVEPRYADSWKRRGQARSALGDSEGALADLQRAIDLAPLFGAADSAVVRGPSLRVHAGTDVLLSSCWCSAVSSCSWVPPVCLPTVLPFGVHS